MISSPSVRFLMTGRFIDHFVRLRGVWGGSWVTVGAGVGRLLLGDESKTEIWDSSTELKHNIHKWFCTTIYSITWAVGMFWEVFGNPSELGSHATFYSQVLGHRRVIHITVIQLSSRNQYNIRIRVSRLWSYMEPSRPNPHESSGDSRRLETHFTKFLD